MSQDYSSGIVGSVGIAPSTMPNLNNPLNNNNNYVNINNNNGRGSVIAQSSVPVNTRGSITIPNSIAFSSPISTGYNTYRNSNPTISTAINGGTIAPRTSISPPPFVRASSGKIITPHTTRASFTVTVKS